MLKRKTGNAKIIKADIFKVKSEKSKLTSKKTNKNQIRFKIAVE